MVAKVKFVGHWKLWVLKVNADLKVYIWYGKLAMIEDILKLVKGSLTAGIANNFWNNQQKFWKS